MGRPIPKFVLIVGFLWTLIGLATRTENMIGLGVFIFIIGAVACLDSLGPTPEEMNEGAVAAMIAVIIRRMLNTSMLLSSKEMIDRV